MNNSTPEKMSEDTVPVGPGPAPTPRTKAWRGRTGLLVALGWLVLVPLGWWLATVLLRVEAANWGPDREAAEWVLSLGGAVGVNDQDQTIKAAEHLPPEAFRLTGVDLLANKKVSDAGLAHFKDCNNLIELGLNGTQVGDAGLAHFKDCKNLKVLGLQGTQVGDAGLAHFKDRKNLTGLNLWGTQVSDGGLAHFKGCKGLTHLNLGNTSVSDGGLAHFKGCKNLMHLYLVGTEVSDAGLAHFKDCNGLTVLDLRRTKVTAEKVEELKKALPRCKIEWDGGVIEPTAK